MISNFLNENNIKYRSNVLLQDITKLSEGRKCKYFCQPISLKQLKILLSYCITQQIDFEVVGSLTNTYFLKKYKPFLIISTLKVTEILVENNYIVCSCGYNLFKLSNYCVNNGIAGYEGFFGIPGTVGAAAINNSGAFQSEMANVVTSVSILTNENKIRELTNAEMNYTTRNSILKNGGVMGYVLSVKFDASKKEEINSLSAKISSNTEYRKKYIDRKRQPLGSELVSLNCLKKRYQYCLLIKAFCFSTIRLFIKDVKKLKVLNTYLFFFFLGVPELAKHCDSPNRFCWDKTTKENDFIYYLNTMQRLAGNTLKLEVDIKGLENEN